MASRGARGGGRGGGDGGGGRGRGVGGGGRGRGDDGGGRGRGDVARGRGDGGGRGRGDGDRGRGDGGRGRGQSGTRGGGQAVHDLPIRSSADTGPKGELVPPSAEVTRMEDQVVVNQRSANLRDSALGLACRPGYSIKGQPIVLRTNYFEISPREDILLYRYSIAMAYHKDENRPKAKEPKELTRRGRRRLMEQLLEKPTFRNHAASVASDYSSTVISAVKLNLGAEDSKTAAVTYFEKEETEPRVPPLQYDCTVAASGTIKIDELMKYLSSVEALPQPYPPPKSSDPKDKDKEPTLAQKVEGLLAGKGDAIQALNIIMSKRPEESPNVVAYGQNNFYGIGDANNMADLGGALVAIRGYYCSVRTSTKRLLVNINVCVSPFYQHGLLVGLMHDYMRGRPTPSLFQLSNFIKGLKVETRYLKNKKGQLTTKVKTLWGLALTPRLGANAKEHKFYVEEFQQELTVEQFFQRKHNIRLQSPTLSLVNVGSKEKPVLLPPEICHVRQGQRHNGALTASQTREMITIACRPPGENAEHIVVRGAPLIGFTGDSDNPLKSVFGLDIKPQMLTVPARVLAPPQLMYSNGSVRPSGGNWNMVQKTFTAPVPVKNWSFLILRGRYTDVDYLTNTVKTFKNSLSFVGMQAENPRPQQGYTVQVEEKQGLQDIRPFDTLLGITWKRLEATFKEVQRAGVKVLLVILPTESPDIYARLKFFGDVLFGIHTVCCQASKISKEGRGQAQYMANVALKFNLKLGGINQSLQANQMGFLSDNKTIVLGIDVTHPSPGSQKNAPSVAGVVSNLNSKCGQWPASMKIQESKVEMVTALTDMVVERLQHWRRKNTSFPTNVLVYRDGVSEGQYELVLRHEYSAILEACRKVGFPTRPKITIVICGKRHHTRFFPIKPEDGDKNGNTKNGTIVDRGVIREREWGFFLQAHTALKGTARSCNYAIIKDEIGLGADAVEELTHNLCYLFGRSTTAVSLCPPAYYADLLCERGRHYLRRAFVGTDADGQTGSTDFDPGKAEWIGGVHVALEDSMFYI